MNFQHISINRVRGTSLIEVLVTLVIVAFGLLGVAAFQAKAQVGSVESYQRAQAIILLEDMTSRINTNTAQAGAYLGTVGPGDGEPEDCTESAPGPERDLCEWSSALKGAAEVDAANTKVGGMIGARGCIDQVVLANPAPGVCTPAVYRVTVAWQGLHKTRAPALACGRDAYGPDTYRRAISSQVTVALTNCS